MKKITKAAIQKIKNSIYKNKYINFILKKDDYYSIIMRHATAPPMNIEIDTDSENFLRLLRRVEDTWSKLGKEEVYWSVITDNNFREINFEKNKNKFLEMGEWDVQRIKAALSRSGIAFEKIDTALDFGCGVGRLSISMAQKIKHVTAVDISESHLDAANKLCKELNINNIEFKKIQSLGDIKELGEFDLVFSLIVLQHNPPPIIVEIIKLLTFCVKPGGHIYIQVPTYSKDYNYSVKDHLKTEAKGMEMHVIPEYILYDTLYNCGMNILEVTEDGAVGDLNMVSKAVLAKKRNSFCD